MLAHTVSQLGYEVSGIYTDAEAALKKYKEDSPDFVLLDFHLGDGKDGIDLAREFKLIHQVPVIMVTAVENDEELKKILDFRPDAYVQKPIEQREMRAVLELVKYKHEKDQEMAELNRSLEDKVKERTEELDIAVKSLIKEMSDKEKMHQQLENALQSEKQFGDLKSKIITNLSHEFKTPLASIRSSAQLLSKMIEKGLVTDKSTKHTERIEESVEILTNLLVRILSVERDQDKLYKAEFYDIDFGVFLESVQEECETQNENDIQIDYNIELSSENIRTDPKLLRLILTNLISNACKYSHQGASISVGVFEDGKNLKFRIKDKGIGMDDDDRDQIYYRFFRAKNVGSIEGTGIGLSIVKRSVDAMMGEIKVASKINEGTCFEVKIPIPTQS